MSELAPSYFALCHTPITQQGGLLLSLFMAGLTGGFTHCTGMCGPFVLSISSSSAPQNGIWRKLTGAELLPYHLGRVTTYSALGFLAAMFAGHLSEAAQLAWLPSALLVVGGVLFLAQVFGLNLKIDFPSLPRFMQETVTQLSNHYNRTRGYMLGVLLGFLPCGLLFSALMIASAAATPAQGALGMMLFGVAIMPALNITVAAKNFLTLSKPQWISPLRKGLSLASAVTLFILAGARYL